MDCLVLVLVLVVVWLAVWNSRLARRLKRLEAKVVQLERQPGGLPPAAHAYLAELAQWMNQKGL